MFLAFFSIYPFFNYFPSRSQFDLSSLLKSRDSFPSNGGAEGETERGRGGNYIYGAILSLERDRKFVVFALWNCVSTSFPSSARCPWRGSSFGGSRKQTDAISNNGFLFPSKSPPGNPQLEEIERARPSNHHQWRSQRQGFNISIVQRATRDARHISRSPEVISLA